MQTRAVTDSTVDGERVREMIRVRVIRGIGMNE